MTRQSHCWAYTLRKPELKKTREPQCSIAALFIIARAWKHPRCPSADEWIRKLWYIHTMEWSIQSVQLLSRIRVFETPWTAARQASLSITSSWSLPKLMSIQSLMPFSHLILCRPILLLPPIPPSIRVFSSESTLHMRWPKYWSFSFSISPFQRSPLEWTGYSAMKKNTFESVLMRWMKLEPIIQSEVSQKEKHQYSILTHTYGI